MKRMIGLIGAMFLIAGCMGEADSQDFYIEGDGGVTWSVLQQRVRSTEERRDFLAGANAGRHAAARALAELGARSVETRIVRDRPPYFIVTEGAFDDLEWMLQTYLHRLCVAAEVELRQVAELTELRITYLEKDGDCTTDEESAVGALVGDFEDFRFVLAEGVFVDSRNFRIEQDDTVAVLLDPGDDEGVDEQPIHRLVWRSPQFGPSW